MAETHQAPRLAARRPGWELPEVHSGLQLAPMDSLYNNKDRIKCPKCGRARAHYCYDCLEALVPFPHVALPFRVSIVTHHEEKASKNTGVQVAVLAAGQVDLHGMSQVPADVDPSRCAVLFPSDTALEVEQLEPDSIDRLFIIDSKWKKANTLVRTDTFSAMRAVRLSQTRSAFWRFHTRGVAEEGVCTVEALFFFLEGLVKQGKLSDTRFTAPHAFDNLLWYFVYQHQVVQQAAQRRLEDRQVRLEQGGDVEEEGEGQGQDVTGPGELKQKHQKVGRGQQNQDRRQHKQTCQQEQRLQRKEQEQQNQQHTADAEFLENRQQAGQEPLLDTRPAVNGGQFAEHGGSKAVPDRYPDQDRDRDHTDGVPESRSEQALGAGRNSCRGPPRAAGVGGWTEASEALGQEDVQQEGRLGGEGRGSFATSTTGEVVDLTGTPGGDGEGDHKAKRART